MKGSLQVNLSNEQNDECQSMRLFSLPNETQKCVVLTLYVFMYATCTIDTNLSRMCV